MKKILTLAVAAFSIATPAMADEASPFTANVALTSDYVFRGISQSNEEPTIQGGMDWADSATGLYAGVWGSGVDFADATTELDGYGGISGTYKGFTWDVGGIYYYYPGSDDSLNYDFWEVALAAGYDFGFMQSTLSLNYSPNYFADSGDAWYPALNVTAPMPYGFTLEGGVARQWIEDNDAFGVPDYTTWSLGASYEVMGFNLNLKYIDTDLSEPSECADGCDARAVFTVSRSF